MESESRNDICRTVNCVYNRHLPDICARPGPLTHGALVRCINCAVKLVTVYTHTATTKWNVVLANECANCEVIPVYCTIQPNDINSFRWHLSNCFVGNLHVVRHRLSCVRIGWRLTLNAGQRILISSRKLYRSVIAWLGWIERLKISCHLFQHSSHVSTQSQPNAFTLCRIDIHNTTHTHTTHATHFVFHDLWALVFCLIFFLFYFNFTATHLISSDVFPIVSCVWSGTWFSCRKTICKFLFFFVSLLLLLTKQETKRTIRININLYLHNTTRHTYVLFYTQLYTVCLRGASTESHPSTAEWTREYQN